MESNNIFPREAIVENIGAIVDFQKEEDDSELEANELANSLNHVINISPSELKPKDKDGSNLDCREDEKTPESPQDISLKRVLSQSNMSEIDSVSKAAKYNLSKGCQMDNGSDAQLYKEGDNTNQNTNPVVFNNEESQHLYENESDINGYENINQCHSVTQKRICMKKLIFEIFLQICCWIQMTII